MKVSLLKDECMIPQIVDDIFLAKDCFRGKTKYFMASEKKSQYLKLNEFQYQIFSEFLPYLKEERNEKILNEKCYEISKGKITIKNVLNILYKYNLFEDSKNKSVSKVMIDFNSKKIVEISLENFQKAYSKIFNVMYYILLAILFATFLLTIYEVSFMHEDLINTFKKSVFNWDQINVISILYIIVEIFLSIILHEFGHLLVANKNGFVWKSLNISFIWGISPVFFIRYKNFCINRSIDKIKVLSAGVIINILQICVYLQLCLLTQSWIFAIGIYVNLSCVINCMIPLGTSDGYHLLSVLFGFESARWKALTLISQMLNNPREMLKQNSKDDILFMIYVVISYVLGIYGCIQLIKAVLETLNILNINNCVITIVVVGIFTTTTIIYIKKFLQSLKSLQVK